MADEDGLEVGGGRGLTLSSPSLVFSVFNTIFPILPRDQSKGRWKRGNRGRWVEEQEGKRVRGGGWVEEQGELG